MPKIIKCRPNSNPKGQLLSFSCDLVVEVGARVLVETNTTSGLAVYVVEEIHHVTPTADLRLVVQVLKLGDWETRKNRDRKIAEVRAALQQRLATCAPETLLRLMIQVDGTTAQLAEELARLENIK